MQDEARYMVQVLFLNERVHLALRILPVCFETCGPCLLGDLKALEDYRCRFSECHLLFQYECK